MNHRPPALAIKTPPQDFRPGGTYRAEERVMYGGKMARPGDRLYVLASDHCGGRGLVARGRVRDFAHVAGIVWRLEFSVDALAREPLGRAELKGTPSAPDRPGAAEIAFKFYRQATNKTAGITAATADWLDGFFA
ncbi:MAG: hypothetical protein R3D84_17340 [Paracoccaceae bacterium]